MFVTQPPLKNFTVRFYTKKHKFKGVKCERSTGVTLGEAYNVIHAKFSTDKMKLKDRLLILGYADEDDLMFGD
jgi:hypothetical protein